MSAPEPSGHDAFPLTDEHRMLLRMRETLYEGHWDDFEQDLRARAQDRPHVFETIPPSPQVKATIDRHLVLIGEMQAWEAQHDKTLMAGA